MKIETGFHGADLFSGWDDSDRYNVAECAEEYARLLKKAIEQNFPGAEVVVSYDLDATGVLPYNLQTYIDGVGGSEADSNTMNALLAIEDIESTVYQEFEWALSDSDEED